MIYIYFIFNLAWLWLQKLQQWYPGAGHAKRTQDQVEVFTKQEFKANWLKNSELLTDYQLYLSEMDLRNQLSYYHGFQWFSGDTRMYISL